MGNETSLPKEFGNFEDAEIEKLKKVFKKLDLDCSGTLSVEEFLTIPGIEKNPLAKRVIDVFDKDGNGVVDFKEFMLGISEFSVKNDKESKLKFLFKIYDVDNDGFISNEELFQVLKMMVGENLGDIQLQEIVNRTIAYADKDGDGKINFDEFWSVVGDSDIHKMMVVDV